MALSSVKTRDERPPVEGKLKDSLLQERVQYMGHLSFLFQPGNILR